MWRTSLGAAQHDDPCGLDRLAVDEQLIVRAELVVERLDPTVATGAQLALADAHRIPALAHASPTSRPFCRTLRIVPLATFDGANCVAVRLTVRLTVRFA